MIWCRQKTLHYNLKSFGHSENFCLDIDPNACPKHWKHEMRKHVPPSFVRAMTTLKAIHFRNNKTLTSLTFPQHTSLYIPTFSLTLNDVVDTFVDVFTLMVFPTITKSKIPIRTLAPTTFAAMAAQAFSGTAILLMVIHLSRSTPLVTIPQPLLPSFLLLPKPAHSLPFSCIVSCCNSDLPMLSSSQIRQVVLLIVFPGNVLHIIVDVVDGISNFSLPPRMQRFLNVSHFPFVFFPWENDHWSIFIVTTQLNRRSFFARMDGKYPEAASTWLILSPILDLCTVECLTLCNAKVMKSLLSSAVWNSFLLLLHCSLLAHWEATFPNTSTIVTNRNWFWITSPFHSSPHAFCNHVIQKVLALVLWQYLVKFSSSFFWIGINASWLVVSHPLILSKIAWLPTPVFTSHLNTL